MKKNSAATVSFDEIENFQSITQNQSEALKAWNEGYNLVLNGSAGTGKTFQAMHFAFKEMLKEPLKYRRVMIMRSLVATRDSGHLPGTKEEKEEPYKLPYKNLCDEIFGYEGAFGKLVSAKKLKFETTSYIRGSTFDQTILIVDEMQNMTFHELDSVITRVGNDCRVIFAGDYKQTDFRFADEKEGLRRFLDIIELSRFFKIVEFGAHDIVRSDFVRDYIITKEMLENKQIDKMVKDSVKYGEIQKI